MTPLPDPKAVVGAFFVFCAAGAFATTNSATYFSPAALAATDDGNTLFIACSTANRVLCFDTTSREVLASIPVPASPSGLALSADSRLFVTCAAPESKVCVVDPVRRKTLATISSGHTSMAPVLSRDGRTLYVCNRFDNDISVIDLVAKRERNRIAVRREPVAADITKDGRFLLVANHLSNGRADADYVAATVSVIDLAAGKVTKEIRLTNGSESLKDIRVSPDGRFAVLTHILASFTRATTRVTAGWINANALTIIDLATMELRCTVLLDDPKQGAANPWGAAWSADQSKMVVAHAGTHDISVIDFPSLLANLPERPDVPTARNRVKRTPVFVSQDEELLPYIGNASKRVKLGPNDWGPRAVLIAGDKAIAANYFSDTLSVIHLAASKPAVESIQLGTKMPMDEVRKGEFYFHDATLCFQSQQSCSSCHPGDARADGLNWDLLNDGTANPKNTKSLLLAHKTPPAMILGIRDTAETAVRAGIRHILFTSQPEAVAVSIDEYLKSLKAVPSPYLARGKLSKAAKRGQKVFTRAGCAECHPAGLFTDLNPYDVGTRSVWDKPTDKFDTPTLVEVWRTAPYLHDGSAATIRDVVTIRNADDQHGKTSTLSRQEIDDLCSYLLSL